MLGSMLYLMRRLGTIPRSFFFLGSNGGHVSMDYGSIRKARKHSQKHKRRRRR